MISKNTVGRSVTVSVKICSRCPSSSRSTRMCRALQISSHGSSMPVEPLAGLVVVARSGTCMKRTPRSRSACDGRDDVVGAQRDVLHAGAVVGARRTPGSGSSCSPSAGSLIGITIVDAVPHDRRHQRRVLGADLVVVEVQQLAEPEHLAVEAHPVVEPALLDVADDVVDGARGRPRGPTRRVREVVVVVARARAARSRSGGGRRTCARSRRTSRSGRASGRRGRRPRSTARAPAERRAIDRRRGTRRRRRRRATRGRGRRRRACGRGRRSATPASSAPLTRRSGCRPARARSSPSSRTPVSGPAYAVQWKPNADIRKPAVVRALPTQNSMQSHPRRCAAGLSVIVMLRSNPGTGAVATTTPGSLGAIKD